MYSSCSFGYYMLMFYVKYLKGDIFANQTASGSAEVLANMLPVIMTKYMSVNKGFIFAFCLSGAACALTMYAQVYDKSDFIPVGILGIKVGAAINFQFLYFASVEFFETQFLGLQLTVCNVIARCLTTAAPIIAEMKDPIPLVVVFLSCVVAAVASSLLK